jgi:hypothetical protein
MSYGVEREREREKHKTSDQWILGPNPSWVVTVCRQTTRMDPEVRVDVRGRAEREHDRAERSGPSSGCDRVELR